MRAIALLLLLGSLKTDYAALLKAGFFDTAHEDDGTATMWVTRAFVRAPIKRQTAAVRTACGTIRKLGDRSADYCYFSLEGFGDVATVFPDNHVEFDRPYVAALAALRDQ